MRHAFDLSKPKFVFASPYAAKRVVEVCKQLNYVTQVVIFGSNSIDESAILLDDFVAKHSKNDFNVEQHVKQKVDIKDQVALIVCSSGTTGLPKGVLLTQENLMSVVQSYRDLFVLMNMIHGKTRVILNIAPWFHALGFMSMLLVACSRDSTFVFLPKFEDEAFLSAIQKYQVNTITVVPPIMNFLAKSPLVDKFDLSSITGKSLK